MPATRIHTHRAAPVQGERFGQLLADWRVFCRDCDVEAVVLNVPLTGHERRRPPQDSIDSDTGRPLTDTFSWDAAAGEPGNRWGRFYTYCRECKRARSRRSRSNRLSLHLGVSALDNPGRRYGVELEVNCGEAHYAIQAALRDAGLTGWEVKYDGSLGYQGAEIVSPPISGDDGREQIRAACRVLHDLGATVSRACGLHVHHEVGDVTVEAFKRLVRIWSQNQPLIDGMVSASRRNGDNQYCRRISTSEISRVDQCQTLEDLRRNLSGYSSRYRTMNLTAYGRYGTVEIRQHQGTIDAEKIISWVEFGQAIIDQARTSPETPTYSRVSDLLSGLRCLGQGAGTYMLARASRFGHAAL